MQSVLLLPSATVTVPVGGPNGGIAPTATVAVVVLPTAVGLGASETRVTTGAGRLIVSLSVALLSAGSASTAVPGAMMAAEFSSVPNAVGEMLQPAV